MIKLENKRLKFILYLLYSISTLLIVVPLVFSYINNSSFSTQFNATVISISFTLTIIGMSVAIAHKKKLKKSYAGEVRFIVILTIFFLSTISRLIYK